jgi:hypothetical protein
MSFEIKIDTLNPEIMGDGVQYKGQRFRVECQIAGKRYGDPFGVDVGIGDPILGEPEVLHGDNLLEFAGLSPCEIRVYPVESHIAEKLHAYSLPRQAPNSRVKDLPDLALLGQAGEHDANRIRIALKQTFMFRKSHEVPFHFHEPPAFWGNQYAKIAEDDNLPWRTLKEVTEAVRSFLDPVLASNMNARWNPKTWTWRSI